MNNRIVVYYSHDAILNIDIENTRNFNKRFKKFIKAFNKFKYGSGLINIQDYFKVEKPNYISTLNVINVYYINIIDYKSL